MAPEWARLSQAGKGWWEMGSQAKEGKCGKAQECEWEWGWAVTSEAGETEGPEYKEAQTSTDEYWAEEQIIFIQEVIWSHVENLFRVGN